MDIPHLTYFVKSTIFALLFIIPSFAGTPLASWEQNAQCPTFCRCYIRWTLKWADCSGQRIYSIHTGVPETVEGMDLSNNSISLLEDYQLQRIGLSNLQYLNLSNNAIAEIGLWAFAGLNDVTIIDLSKNRIHQLLPTTFINNRKLRILRLSHNNFNEHVPHLHSHSLTELNMSSCRLSHLPLGAFNGLKKLHSLDLSDNLMIQLQVETIRAMPNLRILMINKNPWSCKSHAIRKLHDYMRSRRIYHGFDMCSSKNSGKKFEKMVMNPHVPDRAPKTNISPKSENSGSPLPDCPAMKDGDGTATSGDDAKEFENLLGFEPAILAVGFFGGMAVGMFLMYCCMRRCKHPQQRSLDCISITSRSTQRAALLRNICRTENSLSPSPACPETPPPRYRDVVNHSDQYPIY